MTYFPNLKRTSTENKERLIKELVLNEPHKFECKGKKPYNTRNDVNKEIYRIMVESLSNNAFLRSYKCKYCKKWHLTNNDK